MEATATRSAGVTGQAPTEAELDAREAKARLAVVGADERMPRRVERSRKEDMRVAVGLFRMRGWFGAKSKMKQEGERCGICSELGREVGESADLLLSADDFSEIPDPAKSAGGPL